MKLSEHTEEFSIFLNLSRWLAANLVLAAHLRSKLFTSFEYEYENFFEMQLFYFLTNLGSPAVSIFFSISGFLIGKKILSQHLKGSFKPKSYLIDRFTRIYVVLVPALLLTLLLDGIQLNFIRWSLTQSILADFNASNFFSNLLMLQIVFFKSFGSNSALWSLSYEWFFYICFPAHCQLLFKRKLTPLNLTLLVVTSIFFLLNRASFFFYGAWLTGLLINNPLFIRVISRLRYFLFPVSLVSLVVLVPLFETHSRLAYFIYSLNFSILLSYVYQADWNFWKKISSFLTQGSYFHHAMAKFSFSLYAIHCPIIAILIPLTSGQRTFINNTSDYLVFMALMFIPIIWAFLFSLLTEQKRHLVRSRLYNLFKVKLSPNEASQTNYALIGQLNPD